jgi:hypothetical protein
VKGLALASLLLPSSTLLFTGCSDFLEIKPQNEIIMEDFWKEKKDVDAIVSGCYAALQSDAAIRRMMMWGEFRSENVMAGPDSEKDQNLYNVFKENITPKNYYTTWDVFYNVINRCNTVIKYAPEVAAKDPSYSTSELNATLAEVSAIRDLCYFYLIRTFRDVPYTTEAYVDDDQEMQLPATPFYTVLDNLIADLERVKSDAILRYPETKPAYQTGRITQDAINAMLCEMYLWRQDYQNCIRCADLVIDSKKEQADEKKKKSGAMTSTSEQRLKGYPLVDNLVSTGIYGNAFNQIFVEGNSKETVFELIFDNDAAGSTMLSNSAAGQWFGNSQSDGRVAASNAVVEDAALTSSRTIFADCNKKLDARIYENFNSTGNIAKFVYKAISITASGSDATPGYSNRYNFAKVNNVDTWYTSSNWIIYRLSDIMLLKAEAISQLMKDGADTETVTYNIPYRDQAFELVNVVNMRSICKGILSDDDTLHVTDYSTKSAMENLVLQERQRELMFEGKRWYDLVRRSLRDGNTKLLCQIVGKRDGPNSTLAQSLFGNAVKWEWAIFWPYNYEELTVNKQLKANPAYGSGNTSNIE